MFVQYARTNSLIKYFVYLLFNYMESKKNCLLSVPCLINDSHCWIRRTMCVMRSNYEKSLCLLNRLNAKLISQRV